MAIKISGLGLICHNNTFPRELSYFVHNYDIQYYLMHSDVRLIKANEISNFLTHPSVSLFIHF